MKAKEMLEAIQVKNSLLNWQMKKIELLEEKMTELRKKYFQLKYAGVFINLEISAN